MLPVHHLLQLVPNRAKATLDRLRSQLWTSAGVPLCEATASRPDQVSLTQALRLPRQKIKPGQSWGRLFDQRWVLVRLPVSAGRRPRYLRWLDQAEATLYIDGVPYYGFDVAHRQVALPPGAREAWVECCCCQSAIWHPEATGLGVQGSLFGGAQLLHRNDQVWRLLHDYQILFDVMMGERSRQLSPVPAALNPFGLQAPLDKATPLYRQLLRWLDRASDAWDKEGLDAMQQILGEAYRDLADHSPRVRAVLTGHAHIDLVWLWPERVGEQKAVHTFATATRLMELYPEFRFAYSQTASYAAVRRRAPRLFQVVQRRIRSGQWQPTGALYVESDTLLPCGEGLVRSFMLGQEDFRLLRHGQSARLLWLPDVFGYSGCLPQLMKLAGVDYFFTTKLTWSAIQRFPYSSFVWRGNDGSEVMAHVTQDVGYNNRVDPEELNANARGHAQADVHREFLHPVGYGDGGGGPTEEMCERARRLRTLAGVPAVEWDQPEAFFGRLAKIRDQLPRYQGEFYLEYHRGTYTTHGALKAAFRAAERALQIREAVAVATQQDVDLRAVWQRLVFAQFHDYIPGSSVPEVYAEGLPELARLESDQRRAAMVDLERAPGELCVFNPLPLPWKGWLQISGARERTYVELPPLAGVPLRSAVVPVAGTVQVKAKSLVSDRVELTLNSEGYVARCLIDGTPIELAGAAAQLVTYPDRPAAFEAWDIDRQSLSMGDAVRTPTSIRGESMSRGTGTLVVTRKIGRASKVTTRYRLDAGEAVVRMDLEVEWHESETMLKLRFPTKYQGTQARFGAPFGSVRRAQHAGPLAAEAQWEVPGSRYAAVCDESESTGLFIATESKYGFSARDGDLAVTLLRSPRMTGHDSHDRASPRALSRMRTSSIYSDQGRHLIRLAWGRYLAAAPRAEHPAALAETLFTAPLSYGGAAVTTAFRGIVGGNSLMPSWAQPLEKNRWVLRLHEVTGQSGKAMMELAPGHRARKIDLRGKPLGAFLRDGRLSFRPFEIVSLLIGPSPTRRSD